jgi:hypothetical protein
MTQDREGFETNPRKEEIKKEEKISEKVYKIRQGE